MRFKVIARLGFSPTTHRTWWAIPSGCEARKREKSGHKFANPQKYVIESANGKSRGEEIPSFLVETIAGIIQIDPSLCDLGVELGLWWKGFNSEMMRKAPEGLSRVIMRRFLFLINRWDERGERSKADHDCLRATQKTNLLLLEPSRNNELLSACIIHPIRLLWVRFSAPKIISRKLWKNSFVTLLTAYSVVCSRESIFLGWKKERNIFVCVFSAGNEW